MKRSIFDGPNPRVDAIVTGVAIVLSCAIIAIVIYVAIVSVKWQVDHIRDVAYRQGFRDGLREAPQAVSIDTLWIRPDSITCSQWSILSR